MLDWGTQSGYRSGLTSFGGASGCCSKGAFHGTLGALKSNGRRPHINQTLTANVGESIIENQLVVKLLGLHAENLLSFNVHIDVIYRKAGRKLYVVSAFQNSENRV